MSRVMFYLSQDGNGSKLFFYKKILKNDDGIKFFNESNASLVGTPFNPLDSQKERLNYINSLGISEVYKFNKFWVELNTYISCGYFVPNTEFSFTFKLDEFKSSDSRDIFLGALREAFKAFRKKEVLKGVKYKGVTLALDVTAFSSVLSSLEYVDPFPIDFKTESGSFITLKSKEEVVNIFKLVTSTIQKCFTAEKNSVSEVSVITNLELYKLYSDLVYRNDKSELEKIFTKHMEA